MTKCGTQDHLGSNLQVVHHVEELSARTSTGIQNTAELIDSTSRREYFDARLLLIEWTSKSRKGSD